MYRFKIKSSFCLWESMEVPGSSPSASLGQKQLCARELCSRWKGFNKVVSLLLLLPFLLLAHFTNVWMPLMRNQDHSRGAQWSRSCDNLLFRCWLAVELGAASGWKCVCLRCGSGWRLFSFHSNPIKKNEPRKRSEGNLWSKPLLCLPRHPVTQFCFFTILHVITVKQATASPVFMMWQWCRTPTNAASVNITK